MKWSSALVALLLIAASPMLYGEVTSVGPGGFSVQHGVNVEAPPARVFQLMAGQVSSWWLKDHTWSGDAANLSIEPRAGGCFCEQLPEGGSVEHMRVVFVQPGKLLRLQGGLGPLQGMGVNGAMSWQVDALENGGSRIEWLYNVHGFLPGGFEDIASAVDGVLGQQLASLTAELTPP